MELRAEKACTKCGRVKPLVDFYPRKTARDGRDSACSECVRAQRRAYTKANRAKETSAALRWRSENQERYDGYMKKWRSENAELSRKHDQKWRDSNRELKRELDRDFREKNREAIRQKRTDNLEFFRERDRRYRESGAHAERERRRRAVKMGAKVEDVDLNSIWTGRCGLCGEGMDRETPYPDPLSKSIDHIVPLSLGGQHVLSNLQWTHLRCNVAKGNRQQTA